MVVPKDNVTGDDVDWADRVAVDWLVVVAGAVPAGRPCSAAAEAAISARATPKVIVPGADGAVEAVLVLVPA